ncbi:MAG: hypothetical protein CVU39_07935 [Chloroflexi bacterium HGW-Chloroflexi-10]|nr:MAG: hypothetical protein CVU39_07935 [Chloroflexi bacterium HGW-Chloroflexi-10]
MRLERDQQIFRSAYREYDKRWTWLNVDTEQEWSEDTPLEIAFFVYFITQDPITAKFADWRIISK